MTPIILSAGTVLPTPFLDRLALASASGFAGVSLLFPDHGALDALGIPPADVGQRIAAAGLYLSEFESISNWLPNHTPPPGMNRWLAADMLRATPETACALAAAYGARAVCLLEMFGTIASAEVMATALTRAAAIAADHGLDLLVEFVPTGSIPDLATAWNLIQRSGAANLGLVIDSWHFFRSNSSLDLLATIPGSRIGSIQLNDAPAQPEPNLGHAMVHSRRLPGKGELDLHALMAALRRTGTTAPISIEVFSDALNARPATDVIPACAASLAPYRQA